MRTTDHYERGADNPPDIDELSARLTALATRIDTLNGGRHPARPRRAEPRPQSPSIIDKLLAAEPEVIRPAGSPPVDPPASRSEPSTSRRVANSRQWPRLPVPGEQPDVLPDHDEPAAAARSVARPVVMGDHEQRIAELTAVRDRQAQELREAREHLERQALAIKGLRELAAERDAEVAGLTHKLMEAEADKVSLESQLASALREANTSSVRLAAHEGALNNRAADLAAANQLVEDLRAGLAAAQVTTATQVLAAEERLQHRFEAERKLHINEAERRVADLQALVSARDTRVGELEQDKTTLAEEIAALRALLDDSHAEIAAAIETAAGKDSHIAFLDTVLKVTRENSEATVKELIAEFDRERADFRREREELVIKAQTASAFQRDIAQLLPRLLERRAAA